MIRFVLIIWCTLFTFVSADAQNLVYNGSFEEFYSCPFENDLGNGELEKAKGWWKPTYGTSDYFHACNNGIVDVPSNFWGYQPAQDGQGYVGLGAFEYDSTADFFYHEYVQTKLLEKLKPCRKYRFTMYVSLANLSTYAVGDLSVFFSDQELHESTWSEISLSPQLINGTSILTDTIHWMPITMEYVATGFEEFLTLGYKSSDVSGDTLSMHANIPYTIAYYYIDNVSLVEIGTVSFDECNLGEIVIPNIFTPNNDGVNDLWDITEIAFLNPTVSILNRWGQTVATLDSSNLTWDGDDVNEGIYYYVLRFDIGKDQYKQNGFIQLLR